MIAFRAHRGGRPDSPQNQTFDAVGYQQVFAPLTAPDDYYKAAGYNCGGRYNNAESFWRPVLPGEPPARVIFNGQLWIPEAPGIAGGAIFVARICKNGPQGVGVSIGHAACAAKGAFAGDYVIGLAMQDIAAPGDVYRLYCYISHLSAWIDGNALHTAWSGMVV